jgi:hypothetical protein
VEGGLQQPDPGGLSLARAVKHGAHQPSPDRLVLQRRMNRDRPDARDRPTFVEKITTDDLSFLLGHYRVEARIRQHHRQETRRYLCRWKIPGEIVSIVDCLECFEADWAADSGIRGCTRSQHYAHGSPCAELALYSRSFIGCHGPTPLRLRLRGEDCALPLRRTIDGARYGMISTARKRVAGVTVGAAVPTRQRRAEPRPSSVHNRWRVSTTYKLRCSTSTISIRYRASTRSCRSPYLAFRSSMTERSPTVPAMRLSRASNCSVMMQPKPLLTAGDEPVSLGHLSVLPLTVRRGVRSARRPVPRSWPRAPWRAPDQGRRA